MLPNPDVELSAEQLAQLEQAQKLIPKLREQIRRAKLAGLDMNTQEQYLAETEANLSKLMRVYGRKPVTH